MQKKKPTRMCIACRQRESQKDLIRLQVFDKQIVDYTGRGRSFYICQKCAADTKKMRSISKRMGADTEKLFTILKEFVTYGED